MNKGAIFSTDNDKKYRYSLWRIWDETKEVVLFIGLNPSLANDSEDDNTIKKLIELCKNWDFGGFYIANLFAFITPYPKELLQELEPIGEQNDTTIQELMNKCSKTILMWGNNDGFIGRDKSVLKIISNPYCVGITKNGHPIHPLYQKSTSRLREFNQSSFESQDTEKHMTSELSKQLQTITVYKINPNKQERNGDVILDRNVDGRIFHYTKISIKDHAIILENEKEEIEGVFSLHHYYFLKNQ